MTSPARTIVVPAVASVSPFAFLFGTGLQRWPVAEPDDVLDYALDVSAPLADSGDDTIASASVSASPSGDGELSIASLSVQDGIITAWLSGGVSGRTYTIKVEAVTDGGRTFEWLLGLVIDPWLANYPLPRPPSLDFGESVSSDASANGARLLLLF